MDQRTPEHHLDDHSRSTRTRPARAPRPRRTKGWSVKRLPGGWKSVAGVIVLLIVIGVAWAIHSGEAAKAARNANKEPPLPVGVAKATTGDIPIHLNALGTVTPFATVTVRSQVSGLLSSVNFTEGQMVKAGDVLAQIDPRPFQAALDQAKGQLIRDQAGLDNARVDLTRYKTLLAQQSVSEQQYATQAALVDQDVGIVKSDQAMVDAAAINLSFTRITTPVTGRVGLRQVDVGNLVQASNTEIVVVTQIQPISVVFTVPEDNIGDITDRMKSGATLDSDAYDRAWTKRIADGKLSTIDNEIDVTTGTLKLRSTFDNTDGALFPNQFVNIQLLVNTVSNQTIVPTAAIQRGASGTFVFVVNSDNTVKMTNVTLGPADGEQQGVTDGVKAGDTVVIDGADRLRDGAHVQVPDQNGQSKDGTAPQPKANDTTTKTNQNGQGSKTRNNRSSNG